MKKVFVLFIPCLLMMLLLCVNSAQGQDSSCIEVYQYTSEQYADDVTLTIENTDPSICPTLGYDVWRFPLVQWEPGSCGSIYMGYFPEDEDGKVVVNDDDVPPGLYHYVVRPARLDEDFGSRIYQETSLIVIEECRRRDSLTLVELYNSTNGADWNTTWDLTQPIDTWHGVTLNGNGCVESLVMGNNNLTGTLPAAIGDLSELERLGLGGNEINHTIPAEIAKLPQLTNLGLGNNNFTGGIPPEIGSMANLEQLWLANNHNLGGSIPPELGQLTKLTHMMLNSCGLTGSLPKELGRQLSIDYWKLHNNDLSGCYPPELAVICSRLRPGYNGNDKISDGNDLDASWEDFCSNQSGICQAEEKTDESHISDYKIYPNPAENNTTIQLEFNSDTNNEDATLSIYNFNKQLIQSEKLTIQNGQNQFTTTLKNYAAGIYFVKLQSGTYVATQKLVIQ